MLALNAAGAGLDIIGVIGIVLLIGIVKKNAIMMIDFALEAQRVEGLPAREAIYQACLLRLRPILMTTVAAMFGALPLMLGTRRRLGAAPTARPRHRRRPRLQPGVDALYDAGHLPLFRTARRGARLLRRQRRGRPGGVVSGGFSALFIRRPVATILLTIGVALAGALAYGHLPVSPLPQIDFATIFIQANMPGASPDNMATNVAAPLERHLGQIADVTEMTSQSSLGSTRIILQFGLDRDIDGAARDVQAAINAARADLPTSLKQNPSYHKVNPADAPIMVLALTSTTRQTGQLYDVASNILQQRLSQLPGIGEVDVTGSALPAVRVELNVTALYNYGISLEDVRAALASANANSPKGQIEDADFNYQIYANDQATQAAQYRDLVIAYRNHAAVRLKDIADVEDSVEDLRNAGLANGKPAIGIVLSREPGANIIQAVDNVKAELPRLIAALPGDVDLKVVVDRSITIRGSLHDTIKTLITSVALVILVVFVFLRDVRASAVPSVAVPVSIIGSFAAMYVLGFSLNNLSLMALTISTGFVVDDAIVVLENVSRHLEMGKSRVAAAIAGAREVGFTVVSISLSLVAVFLPLLLMGGLVGRLFKEFTVTLSMAVLISMVVSLTTTPMMCALILPRTAKTEHGRLYRITEAGFDAMLAFYRVTLDIAMRYRWVTIAVFVGTLRAQRPPVPKGALQPVPGAGYRIDDRHHSGRPEHLVSVDEEEARAIAGHRAGRSRGRHGGRRHRRPAGEFRVRLHLAEALRQAQDHRRRRGQPVARQTWAGRRGAAVPGRGLGPAHRRPTEQRDLSIYDVVRRLGGAVQMVAAADAGADELGRPEGRQLRSAAGGA